LKEVVCKILGSARAARISDLADLKGRKDDDRKKAALELRAKLFAYRATQAIVEKMIVALSDSLIQDRDERAKAVVSQLLNHPDIKPILADIAAAHWQIDPKQLLVIDHILVQLKEAISVHKNRKNEASRRLYRILLNICSPPPGAKLQRASAKLLGINIRRGLIAAGMRTPAQQVAGVQVV
jgi:hypothetical protein